MTGVGIDLPDPPGPGPTVLSDPTDPELRRLAELAGEIGPRRLWLDLDAEGTEDPAAFPHRDESYRLIVSDSVVALSAPTHAGLFYGIQTLHQLAADGGELPSIEIRDEPRFGYRGMHLDVVRHTFPVAAIKRLIDEMARLKLNAFHWHLTDDQGWRIPIDAYPRLVEVGAWRAETVVGRQLDPYVGDGEAYGGYYTQDQIRDVVAYAAERYVTVIPEIEMPGHATAALAAYPELSCTSEPIKVGTTWGVYEEIFCPSEATFRFLETVLDEVMELFPGPYVHIGGDEVPKTRWEQSPVAQAVMRREGLADEEELQGWFTRRIERYVNAHGRTMIGWDEILDGGAPARATVMSWRGVAGGIEAARSGHDVIMSPNADLYLDFYQGDPASEPLAIGGFTSLLHVYCFEPVPEALTPEEARHILGPQANVWTEYMPSPDQVEYMVFPRLLALAEVAWTPAASRDSTSFLHRLPKRLAALEGRGIGYRVPPPTGLEEDLPTLNDEMTVRLGGLSYGTIHYTLDGSEPGPGDPVYRRPLRVSATREGTIVSARRFSPGRRPSPLTRAVVRRVDPLPAMPGPSTPEAGLVSSYFETAAAAVADLDDAVPSQRTVQETPGLPEYAREEYFGLSLEGWIQVPTTGIYRFTIASDDGSVLTIGGRTVVDHDGYHGLTRKSGSVALAAGRHMLRLRYFQAGGNRGLSVHVRRPDGHESSLPADWLLHEAGAPGT
jgi:hexosaminidase